MQDNRAKDAPLHIVLFVDGFTLKKVNEFYSFFHPYHCHINFRGLRSWARREALRLFSPRNSRCTIECHYYHPYKLPVNSSAKYRSRGLERELHYAGFNVHYAERFGKGNRTPNLALLEDAQMLASFGRIDVAILLSTQGEFFPFPERLKAIGVRTLLLGWEFTYEKENRLIRWRTDPCLRASCDFYVAMDAVANANPPSMEGLTGLFRKGRHGPCSLSA